MYNNDIEIGRKIIIQILQAGAMHASMLFGENVSIATLEGA
jgi:hypothetical protein